MTRETAVLIAPGRGTYNAGELGYLRRLHSAKTTLLDELDTYRAEIGLATVSALDGAEQFSAPVHALGVNAAALIYACAMADLADVDRDRFDIVAVTGNSLGWYLALAAAGVTRWPTGGFALVETLAMLMDQHGSGGQLVYPLVDGNWRPAERHVAAVERVLEAAHPGELFVSIRLGGLVVLAGSDTAIDAARAALPGVDNRYPLRLAGHAAFHTPLLADVSAMALAQLPVEEFGPPQIPLIDGRGDVWQAHADTAALREYTLRNQVLETYDFSRAIEVAIKEFAPDRLIVLGPGNTLGAPVLQELCRHRWLGHADRKSWLAHQEMNPFVLAMGNDNQRKRVTG